MTRATPLLLLLLGCAHAPAPTAPPPPAPPAPAPPLVVVEPVAPVEPPPPPAPVPVEPTPAPMNLPPAPVVEGWVEAGTILPVIEARVPQFRACWEAAKAENPALSSRMLLRIDINDRGRVTQASLRTDPVGEFRLEACVLKPVMTLAFPVPRDGGVGIVKYPLDFGS